MTVRPEPEKLAVEDSRARDQRVSLGEPARGEKRALGKGLTKAKMSECQWLKPVLVGQFESLEWTGDNHLWHSKFVGLREHKKDRDVRRD